MMNIDYKYLPSEAIAHDSSVSSKAVSSTRLSNTGHPENATKDKAQPATL